MKRNFLIRKDPHIIVGIPSTFTHMGHFWQQEDADEGFGAVFSAFGIWNYGECCCFKDFSKSLFSAMSQSQTLGSSQVSELDMQN